MKIMVPCILVSGTLGTLCTGVVLRLGYCSLDWNSLIHEHFLQQGMANRQKSVRPFRLCGNKPNILSAFYSCFAPGLWSGLTWIGSLKTLCNSIDDLLALKR